ncbi:uncharacterized protein PV06_01258 [Exophiala oligosperma]|uniref:Carboxymuconolactone decarboxylase-like domain-containing protein n=2 Tax=Chaetothyriales TaxID=34395 RepID=A0A0D2B909_9EURO|nr:uncharacterized protein PV06_01258 [Exophiala oligosperma]KAJ9628298.1 hypothetical protein H2204_009415 [Knufia peltigerae]KIW48691.1 hypothetical protein PV06_01258 [Exophiala oligosperma]
MRLHYIAHPSRTLSAGYQEIVQRIETRRRATGLLPLDLTLLHAPEIANGWNTLFDAIRTKNSLAEDIREIAICRTALINRAWFEWNAHAPILQHCKGFTIDQFETVKQRSPSCQGVLNNQQWAVLRYADIMTTEVAVPQALFDEVRATGFSAQQMVELTATIATYNMVGRFLVALDVGEENDKPPDWAV